jgi:hypothetical protein
MVERDVQKPPARYYSAYLWIMFVLLRKTADGRWVVLHAPEKAPADGGIALSEEPWKASIPFFEHANLADPESLAFGKRQLAAKAVGGLAEMAALLPDTGSTIRLAYATAVDDANCGGELAFDSFRSGARIVDLVKARLELARSSPRDPAARLLERIGDDPILDFDFFDAEPGRHPHSACGLPVHIRAHYDWLGANIVRGENAA